MDKKGKIDKMRLTRAPVPNTEAVIKMRSSIGLIKNPVDVLPFFFISRL
jgi:hypothetical protein